MNIFAPDYYGEFKCIADKCRHNCCIGWEIDIDSDTLKLYNEIGGELGKKLKSSIVCEDNTAYFRLGEKERCPFLNENNLCEIILEQGDGALCDICTDHPRFRNFVDDAEEIGLGLCCEAAAELILNRKEKVCITHLSGKGESGEFFLLRQKLFDILQNRNKSVFERLKELCNVCGVEIVDKPYSEWAEIYLSLERLDEGWTDMLESLIGLKEPHLPTEKEELMLEQLAVYFLYRHAPDDMAEAAAFTAHATKLIWAIYCANKLEFTETARMYSAEIEYSSENKDILSDIIL